MMSVGGGDQSELSKRGAYLGGDMFFTLQKNWIVGPYNELTGGAGLARRLRTEDALRDRLAVREAAIGRRSDEKLPVGQRTIYGFRRQIEGIAGPSAPRSAQGRRRGSPSCSNRQTSSTATLRLRRTTS